MTSESNEKHAYNDNFCPYWSLLINRCMLTNDYNFKPTDYHVSLHCISSNFSSCDLYNELNQNEKLSTNDNHKEKRLSSRIKKCKIIYFSKIKKKPYKKINNYKRWEQNMWTFNFSEYGMCFASKQFFNINDVIRFSINNGNLIDETEGVGGVAWCAQIKCTSFFKVGLSVDWLFR